ncbi:MAG: YwmB family TATA-box binding protein, partial [Clostridiales bacterium]|nr:YwmB family TATA-box binding protein [Candidatus Apopatousia equi]
VHNLCMAKKFLCFYVLLILSLTCVLLVPNKTPIFTNFLSVDNNLDYFFYTNNLNKDLSEDCLIIKNGDSFIVKCSKDNANDIKKQLDNIKGESITFKGSKSKILSYLKILNAEIVLTENMDNIYSVYAYSKNIPDYVYINHQKVNIQISCTDDTVSIGTPLILGSF